MRSGTLASSGAAVVGALAALSWCLPLGPFLLAAGSAGASGIFVSLEPYLIAFAVLMLVVGFVQAFRARKCGRGRRVRAALGVVLFRRTGRGSRAGFGGGGWASGGRAGRASADADGAS